MKTNNSLVIATILLSIFASNPLGVLRSPYAGKPYPPDRIVLIGEEQDDWVRTTLRNIEMNGLVADQAALATHEVTNFKSEKQTQKPKEI